MAEGVPLEQASLGEGRFVHQAERKGNLKEAKRCERVWLLGWGLQLGGARYVGKARRQSVGARWEGPGMPAHFPLLVNKGVKLMI